MNVIFNVILMTGRTLISDSVASRGHFGSFLLPRFDEVQDLVHLRCVDLGSLLDVGEGVADCALLRSLRASLHKLVVNRRLDEDATAGATTLAWVE